MTKDRTLVALHTFFNENEDLKVFGMNGSRVNRNIPDDSFKDYDVVFFTDSISKYKDHPEFLTIFGRLLLVTEPELNSEAPFFPNNTGYIYLVQYENGVRIDIQFRKLSLLEDYIEEDSLTMILGDKEGRIKESIIPDDSDYWLEYPSQQTYLMTVKEFWWEYLNVLKATIRGELLLAQFYLNLTRDELVQIMTWTVALEQGFQRSYGKKQTQLLKYLGKKEYQQLMKTFDTSTREKIFDSLKTMAQLEIQNTIALEEQMNVSTQNLKESPETYLKSKGQEELAAYFSMHDS